MNILCRSIELITPLNDDKLPGTPVPFVSAITSSSALFHAGAPRVMSHAIADKKLWALLERTPTIEFTLTASFTGQDITDEFVKQKLESLRCERFGFQVQKVVLNDCAVTGELIPFFAGIASLQELVFEKCPALFTEDTLCDMMDRTEKKYPTFIVEAGLAAMRAECERRNVMSAFFHSSRLATILAALLDFPKYEVQYDALWLLANFTTANSAALQVAASLSVFPKIIPFLDVRKGNMNDEKLREQAAWFLGKTAGEGAATRDQLLDAGVMQPLLACLEEPNLLSRQTCRNATWCLAQLCRNKPVPNFDKIKICLPTVRRLLEHPDTETQDSACWAISYIVDGPEARAMAVHEAQPGFLKAVLQLLETKRETVLLPAIRTFGNYSAMNDIMAQTIIDHGILPKLGQFLVPAVSRQIRKEICWMISNITAGPEEQVQAVIDAGVLPNVVAQLQALEFEVRREAMYVVVNLCIARQTRQDNTMIRHLVEQLDVLPGINHLLATMGATCSLALEALELILPAGDTLRESNGGRNPYVDRFEQLGGKATLLPLRDHMAHNVFVRSVTLAETYFNAVNCVDNKAEADGE